MTAHLHATKASSTQDINFATDDLGEHEPLTLTDVAAEHIKMYIEKHKDNGAIAMRLAVERGGCSGKQYNFDLTNSIDASTDLTFAKNGAQVVISKKDFTSFAGLEIDVKTEGLNKYVVFRNPNAKQSCGCGKSFS